MRVQSGQQMVLITKDTQPSKMITVVESFGVAEVFSATYEDEGTEKIGLFAFKLGTGEWWFLGEIVDA